MKKLIIVFAILIQMTAQLSAQSFEFIYSTPDDEVIQDVIQDTAGNYYLIGWKGVFGSFFSGLIIKLNPAGDTIKTLTIPAFNINDYLFLEHILRLNDSVFVITGDAPLVNSTDRQILYYKMDNDLNILDFKSFGGTNSSEYVMRLKKGPQNELLLTGYSYDTIFHSSMFLYKISPDGDSLQSFYPGFAPGWVSGFDILNLPDTSGYFLFINNGGVGGMGNEILKVSNSNTIDTIVDMTGQIIVTARWLNDSVFATINSKFDTSSNPSDIKLQFRKYDFNLNLVSDTLIGIIDTNTLEPNNGIDFTNPNNIFAGGTINYSNYFAPNPAYFYLIGFDNNMTPQWQKIFSHNDDYLSLWGVHATHDGGVLLYGTRYNYLTSGFSERDVYVLKLDSLGNFTTGINNPIATQVHDVIMYPNPAHDVINIRSTINFPATEIILFDASGRIVMEKKFSSPPGRPGGASASFSVKHLNAGIYFYNIKSSKGNEVRGKMVRPACR
ncbi:MAG TPA: T9SS type A sorting domain-containing protein [Bacteroidia bacterium]|nr:T9SS type A sorting domain-containing protein [Bacteroidia bacterium]